MKKISLFPIILIVFAFVVPSIIAEEGKYADFKAAMEEFTVILAEFLNSLETVETGEALAASMDKTSEKITKFAPKIQDLMKKYPELKDMKEPPAELKPTLAKWEKEMMPKFFKLYEKLQKFKDDKAVEEANARFQKAMQLLDSPKEETKEEKAEEIK